MATVLFAAAGAALGSGFGGTVLGLSGAVIGRAVGATIGRVIDQRLVGLGSEAVDVGRVDRFRVMGASEGAAIAKTWGRMRLAGQVIWASDFTESSTRSGGGKGSSRPSTVSYAYTVSMAIALCEGEILGIGRIWADGAEIDPSTLDIRVYPGTADQMPDPALEAELGAGRAPAFRETAYVVIETMDLSPFGNRVPQMSFEVIRPAKESATEQSVGYDTMIRAVALIPGTGEYALATDKINVNDGLYGSKPVNVHSRAGTTDFSASFDQLTRELPECGALSLVVSWFGDDLRCGQCTIQPKVEQNQTDGLNMLWRSGGVWRSQAAVVPTQDGRSIYGGTPADGSVIQAIQAAQAAGRKIMFYPFVLMEQLDGNTLPNPYGGAAGQPVLPWRGRITLSSAPGQPGSPDLTAAAETEVATFFGAAQISDFSIASGQVDYFGAAQWGYRRFILHYAHLCKLAGGVEAFCIGSELRGLTQIRGAGHSFPAVAALKQLAADVRSILGASTKISYAADWSEYFGYHRGGNVYFHLDPLWSDPNIDFIGIDNYMPLSDWRDEPGHADASWKTIANLDYLKSNICGGEGFDWYYDGEERRLAQLRLPVEDGAHGEPWVFRNKDLQGWWSNLHHNRIDGVRASLPTGWIPGSKPFWFTEYGCAALDKGTNEPNKFLDAKSSESSLPRFSNGNKDNYIQFQYYRAMHEYWNDPANNPASAIYSGKMLDTARLFAWAWDARPYPEFPRNETLWADGTNYRRGHWLNGRASSVPLDNLVREVCGNVGLEQIDTKDLHGIVTGYSVEDVGSVRAILQPLSVAYGFDAVEAEGVVRFMSRGLTPPLDLLPDYEALSADLDRTREVTRLAESEIIGRSRLVYVSSDGDFAVKVAEAVFADDDSPVVSQSELALSMTAGEAKAIVERWLAEARTARDFFKIRLPASACEVGAGSVLNVAGTTFRVDRVEIDEGRMIEAVRIEDAHYALRDADAEQQAWAGYSAPSPVVPVWMDLPLLRGTETPHAPHIAATADPWPGTVAVWGADQDDGYGFVGNLDDRAVIGTTLTPLAAARPGLFDRGDALIVKLASGSLSSLQLTALLNGGNTMAIGNGSSEVWEVFQYQTALLIDENTYEISGRLRGQVGSDGIMPAEWPIGSQIVVLNSAVRQVPMLASLRGVARHYRVGLAAKGYDDPDVTHHILSFRGNGLRPYRVAHLRAVRQITGDRSFSWIRRTRIDGDNWDSFEVPVGEGAETYQITVKSAAGTTLRSKIISDSMYLYTAAEQVADGAVAPFTIEVAQISESYGPGPVARLDLSV